MQFFPAALQNLTDQFARLPGIGGKTAQRLAFYVLSLPQQEAQSFADAIVKAKQEVIAMERSREYRGVYHVLHGVISPLNHVTQNDIRIRELLLRVGSGNVHEVIMATNPDTEGEATAMYISRLLRPMEVKVTRLAYGVPVGSQLEYADEVTLSRALEGRQEI